MAEVETSQPAGAGQDAVSALSQLLAENPIEDVAVAAPQSETPAAEPQSPATIIIPLSKIPEKFRSKPESIVEAYENAEKTMHGATAEAARLRKEAEELRVKLATAEQVSRMTQQPQQQPQNHWQQAGINPGEDIITSPDKVGDHILTQATKRAEEAALKAAAQVEAKLQAQKQTEEQTRALFWALDTAKVRAKEAGYDFTDDEYKNVLMYVGPVVAEEAKQNPNAPYDPNRYVEHIKMLKGAPTKAALPTEGAPPVASRSATMQNAPSVPTLSREDAQLQKAINGALGKWLS